jgi:hypothetical protein
VSLRPFLSGARAAVRLVASDRVAARWDEPSALPGMTTGELTAHLARAVLQVAARRRHGDVAVLRALARRERDQVDAARVL